MSSSTVCLKPELPKMLILDEVGVEPGGHLPDLISATNISKEPGRVFVLSVGARHYVHLDRCYNGSSAGWRMLYLVERADDLCEAAYLDREVEAKGQTDIFTLLDSIGWCLAQD